MSKPLPSTLRQNLYDAIFEVLEDSLDDSVDALVIDLLASDAVDNILLDLEGGK